MTQVGILEGWSSAVGDELTELGGFRSTRLTAQLKPEESHQTGINSASSTQATTALLGLWTWQGGTAQQLVVLSTNTTQVQARDYIRLDADGQWFRIVSISVGTGPAGEDEVTIENPSGLTIPSGTGASSVVDPAVITIPGSPDFLLTVAAGMRFRLLSGPLTGVDVVIASRDSGTQITAETGFPASFSAQSWQIVSPAETVAQVETTLDWDGSGEFWLDGVRYRYGSKTLTTLEQLQHFDGVAFVTGARRLHQPLAVVADFSRTFSAVDRTRRAFLLEYATGTDLDVIGQNLGVPRPPELSDDETYRALIKSTAYSPRGTIHALELALTALLGAGNFEIFEDLTLGSINHPARVYFRRTDLGGSEQNAGKAFLEGPEYRPPVSTTQIDATEPLLTVQGVRLAPEGGLRQSASGAAASSTTGDQVTGPAAQFPTAIEPLDLFRVLSGPLRGREALVRARVSDTQLDLMTRLPGLAGAAWETIRRGTPTRTQRPTADASSEFGIVPTEHWLYSGNGVEATDVVIGSDATDGQFVELTDPDPATTVGYAKKLRIRPESDAYVEVRLSPQNAPPHGSFGGDVPPATDGEQFLIGLTDGERDIRVGVFGDLGATRFRFIDQAGNRITAGVTGIGQNISPGTWGTVRIVKRGQQTVELWVGRDVAAAQEGMRLVQSAAYSAFPTSAVSPGSFQWGMFATTQSGYIVRVKDLQWGTRTPTDYWNTRISAGQTAAPNRLIDGGSGNFFQPTDVGKTVRIFDFQIPNGGGGTPIGEWEIAAFVNLNTVDLVGPTLQKARLRSIMPDRIEIAGARFPFVWPHVRGHQIVIETGPNAGTYDIAAVLDPTTLLDVDQFPDMTAGAQVAELPEIRSNVVQVSNPPVGGFVNDEAADWHLEPVFAADAGPIRYEIVDTGNVQNLDELHLDRQPLPFAFSGAWTSIWEIVYTRVLSAQVRDEDDRNELTGPNTYSLYPFYLEDSWGFLRVLLDRLTVAGVLADTERFFRDDAGPHILV